MFKKIIIALLFTPFVIQLWGADVGTSSQYFRVFPSGISRYKIEAMRQIETPKMRTEAMRWSADPRVQELICLAQGLDSLVYDGFRLVRLRGCLVTSAAIDEYAVERAIYYFNVTPTEARAWLLASRLMQMSDYKDDGVALWAIEQELLDTAGDLYARLDTYVGSQAALSFMPRLAWGWGYDVLPSNRLAAPVLTIEPRPEHIIDRVWHGARH